MLQVLAAIFLILSLSVASAETPEVAAQMALVAELQIRDNQLDAEIRILGRQMPYVGRGGLKLEAALREFKIEVSGKSALDVGASTGGFTDCLLQHGCQKVYAVDVGYGQLAWKLRQDPRVVAIDRVNIRDIDPALVPERVDIAMALWDSLTPAEQEAEFDLTPEQLAELDRRLAEHIADPASAIPWDEVRRKLLRRA